MSKTIGEKLLNVKLSNAPKSEANLIKQEVAKLINMVQRSANEHETGEAFTIHNEAIRQLMTGQMWAVKAITYDK